MTTQNQSTIGLAWAAGFIILALIVAMSPPVAVIANEVPEDVRGVDVLHITMTAAKLPEQQFPAH